MLLQDIRQDTAAGNYVIIGQQQTTTCSNPLVALVFRGEVMCPLQTKACLNKQINLTVTLRELSG